MAGKLFGCTCFHQKTIELRHLDYRHRGLAEVPAEVFAQVYTLEELHLDNNNVVNLHKELFCCHELRKFTISDNDVKEIPAAVGNFVNLTEIDISRNNIEHIPETIKQCKCLEMFDASVNPLGKLPDSFTQLLNLTCVLLNDCYLNYLPGNIGRLANLRILEVRENHLSAIPNSVSRLTKLERLDIGNNELSDLPEGIGFMNVLLEMWCDQNKLTYVPKSIGNLRQLMSLDLSNNTLKFLPSEIEGCSSLSDLHLSNNQLQQLPESIGRLTSLTTLKLDKNRLTSLPFTIGGLVSLSELNLSANFLEGLPPSVGLLRHLRVLYVNDNHLLALPPEMGSCSGITVLHLRGNQLKCLPEEIGRIPRLHVMNISDNRLRSLPFSFTKLRQLHALWLSDNQTQPLVQLQSDRDPDTGERCLTCYLLPQMGGKEENSTLSLTTPPSNPGRRRIQFEGLEGGEGGRTLPKDAIIDPRRSRHQAQVERQFKTALYQQQQQQQQERLYPVGSYRSYQCRNCKEQGLMSELLETSFPVDGGPVNTCSSIDESLETLRCMDGSQILCDEEDPYGESLESPLLTRRSLSSPESSAGGEMLRSYFEPSPAAYNSLLRSFEQAKLMRDKARQQQQQQAARRPDEMQIPPHAVYHYSGPEPGPYAASTPYQTAMSQTAPRTPQVQGRRGLDSGDYSTARPRPMSGQYPPSGPVQPVRPRTRGGGYESDTAAVRRQRLSTMPAGGRRGVIGPDQPVYPAPVRPQRSSGYCTDSELSARRGGRRNDGYVSDGTYRAPPAPAASYGPGQPAGPPRRGRESGYTSDTVSGNTWARQRPPPVIGGERPSAFYRPASLHTLNQPQQATVRPLPPAPARPVEQRNSTSSDSGYAPAAAAVGRAAPQRAAAGRDDISDTFMGPPPPPPLRSPPPPPVPAVAGPGHGSPLPAGLVSISPTLTNDSAAVGAAMTALANGDHTPGGRSSDSGYRGILGPPGTDPRLVRVSVTVRKSPGLGFSIAGGVGSPGNPFRNGDPGIFVTKVTSPGPAEHCLRPGDKILSVNGIDFAVIDHNQAVGVLKTSDINVDMVVERMMEPCQTDI